LSEVFATGAVFRLIDEFDGPLRRLIGGLESAEKKAVGLQGTLDKLGLGTVATKMEGQWEEISKISSAGVDKVIKSMARLGPDTGVIFGEMTKGARASFEEIDISASGLSTEVVEAMKGLKTGAVAELQGIGAAAPELFQPIASAATAASDAAIGSLGRINDAIKASVAEMQGLSTEAAAVAARSSGSAVAAGVAPVSGVGQAVATSGGASLRTRTMAAHDQNNAAHGGFHFRPHGMAIPGGHLGASQGGDGMAPLVGGLVIGELLKKGIEAGFDFEHWRSIMTATGATQQQISDAVAVAWKNAASNVNASATSSLKTIIEANKITGSYEESFKLLPALSIAQTAMQSVKAEDLHSHFNEGQQTLRLGMAVEEMGATRKGNTDEERLASTKSYIQELTRTMISTRGLVDGMSLYAMTNMSKGLSQNWDERMATVVAPIIGDVLRASKMGNADYMISKSYAGGGITSKATGNLVKLGFADVSDTYTDKMGMHLSQNSPFAEGLNKNLWDWSNRMIERLKARGVDTNNQETMNDIVTEVASNVSTANVLRALLEPQMRQQMEKEFILRDKVPTDAAGILQNTDPVLKMDALHKKWEDLMTALGGPLVDPAIAVLTKLTSGINAFAQAMEAHPDLTKVGAMGAGVAALGLTGYGAARMLGFGGGGAALSGAATALDASALALKEAAAALSGRALPGVGAGPGGTSPGYTNLLPRAAGMLFQLYELGQGMPDALKKAETDNAPVEDLRREIEMGNAVRGWFSRFGGTLKDAIIPSAHAEANDNRPLAGTGVQGILEDRLTRSRASDTLELLQERARANVWQFGQLNDTTGIVKTSFDGLNTRATGITGALASFSAALDAATAKVYGLFGGGAGAGVGDVGSGSGFTNAAYTTWDSAGGGSGVGSGSARSMPSIRYGRPNNAAGGSLVDGPVGRFSAGGSFAQKSPKIMSRLMGDFSLDAPMAAKIMGNIGHESMGFRAFNEIGGGGGIGWPQWTGSRNREFRAWSAANHLDVHSDEANYGFLKHELAGRYASSIAGLKAGGSLEGFERSFEGAGVKAYGSRHAYERAALDAYSHRGATVSAGRPAATVSAPPPRKVSPGAPAGGNMTTAMNDARPQQHHIYLDGKKIAQVVTKHQASAMRFPNSMGGPDPHSHYVSPGTPVSDVA